jgi:hypothetical protein
MDHPFLGDYFILSKTQVQSYESNTCSRQYLFSL